MALNPAEIVFPVAANSEISGESEPKAIFSYHAGPVKVPGPWKRGRPRGLDSLTSIHRTESAATLAEMLDQGPRN
ncbi:uncharacterized protein SPSK_10033 [Sporothrix schenckii 1099-18]|uniref:Uncharacterized protein n=1 Tax=Sporothrix schenckii 1099-18 TaxID=1397361 RepID=A0A0F2MAD3_SPOSC|nr:uncharacterized protein SPSK_10033 [Sporothrix schenckii 1099-18]KJR86034.1 hypothetical protein SPSK_10033 [Sporothrix schenckii 1099-18]